MKIPESLCELVATGPFGHLTTINADGSPQVTVVWVGIEDDTFVIGHVFNHHKLKNIRRDNRVVLSMLGSNTINGLREHAVIQGRATVEEGGGPALLEHLAKTTYLDLDGPMLPEEMRKLPGFVTRIVPEKIGGIGPWNPESEG